MRGDADELRHSALLEAYEWSQLEDAVSLEERYQEQRWRDETLFGDADR